MIFNSKIYRRIVIILCFSLILGSSSDVYSQYAGFNDPGARTASNSGGGPATGLTPVAPNVDGGTIPVGATAQVVVRFRNDDSQAVKTGLIRLYPSSTVSGEVALNQCEEEALPPGAECAIALSVKALQSGPWRMEMLMSHSGKSRLVTATLSGLVEAGGEGADKLTSDIEAIPGDVDFGSLEDSQTLIESIILRNRTSNKVDINDIYIDTSEQAGYSLKTECESLEAGQACIAVVTWQPKLAGRSSGVLVVKHSGPTALASVPLKGEYTPSEVSSAAMFPQALPGRGLLVSSQTLLDFGASVETASTITVSLVNAGDSNLTLQDISISGSDNGLDFKPDGCQSGTILKPVEACPLTLTWSPTRVGPIFDDIQISHDGARGVLVLPVRGTSVATVSQDQKAIVLSSGSTAIVSQDQGPSSENDNIESQQQQAARRNSETAGISSEIYASNVNPISVLDGYKITSFSPSRAIISGPGGSRIVFNDEEIVLGGVPWFVSIQKNGIEFMHQGQRVLLLFDRSLSSASVNRSSPRTQGTPSFSSTSSSSADSSSAESSESSGDSSSDAGSSG